MVSALLRVEPKRIEFTPQRRSEIIDIDLEIAAKIAVGGAADMKFAAETKAQRAVGSDSRKRWKVAADLVDTHFAARWSIKNN